MKSQHKLLILSVQGLSLIAGMECKLAPPKHPSSPSKSLTFLLGAKVGWFSFTYQSGFQLIFALGNLTKLNVVLPVREIPSCFRDRICRTNPLPRAHKNSLKELAASPAEVHRLLLHSSTNFREQQGAGAHVCSSGMYIAGWAVARPLTQPDYMLSLQDIWEIVKYLQALQSLGSESTVSPVRQSRTFGPVSILTSSHTQSSSQEIP